MNGYFQFRAWVRIYVKKAKKLLSQFVQFLMYEMTHLLMIHFNIFSNDERKSCGIISFLVLFFYFYYLYKLFLYYYYIITQVNFLDYQSYNTVNTQIRGHSHYSANM